MNFTPWTLLVDTGIISVLLLLGKLLRSKVRFIQRFFIPPSLLAGLTALILGPEVLGWLPLSDNMGTYAGILIALVFSCIPLTSERKESSGGARIGRMWAYSQGGMLLQWALGGALGLWVFSLIWPVNPAMGLSMPAGFCGGHGTAAAMGESFAAYGVEETYYLSVFTYLQFKQSSKFNSLILENFGYSSLYFPYSPSFPKHHSCFTYSQVSA